MTPEPSPDRVRAAQAALARVRARWLHYPGVTAVDVGLGGGAPCSGDPVLRVHVEDRRAADKVAAELPEEVEGFAVRVIEARYGPQGDRNPPAAR